MRPPICLRTKMALRPIDRASRCRRLPKFFDASAKLGAELELVLDSELGVLGVTQGVIRPELRALGLVTTSDPAPINPKLGDFDINVGWGHVGVRGAVTPGHGKLTERKYSEEELDALQEGSGGPTGAGDAPPAQLGEPTLDIYLNERMYWKNVPSAVWRYHIGGYQVLKKWLSYREASVLGRSLSLTEIHHFTSIVRHLAALVLMEPALDANYRAVSAIAVDWAEEQHGWAAETRG
jgi:Type ISP C-terminal specificity domain